MPQSSVTRIRGLWTSPNDVNAPDGSLAVADEVDLSRPGMAQPRRGMLSKGDPAGVLNAITEFGGQLVAHVGTNTVQRSADSGATWTSYSGTYAPPDSNTPVTFTQQGGSLFMNTAAGEYELDSVTGTWRLTGSPRGLDGTATLQRTSSTSGWASPDGEWAYRAVWGYKNSNNFVQLGSPSGRFIVVNPATFDGLPGQVSKANGTTTVTVNGPTHGLTTGEYIDVVLGGSETYFLAGTFQVIVSSTTIFTYSDGVNNGSGVSQNAGANITYGMTRNVSLNIPIPSGITTSNFVQVYRSAKSASDSDDPSDVLGQIAEIVPTNVDVSNGFMTWTDVTPDALRGAPLYTSELGMAYAYERPPLSRCKAVWKESTFYGATEGAERLTVQLLSTSYLYTGAAASILAFGDDCGISPHASTENSIYFKLVTSGTTAQNIADTARSMVRSINLGTATHHVRAWYISGDSDPPGIIMVERDASYGQFEFTIQDGGAVEFSPMPLNDWGAATGGVVRSSNIVTVTTLQVHDFVVGQQVTLEGTGTVDFPAGVKTIASVPTTSSFTYAEVGDDAVSVGAIYFIRAGPSVLSDSGDRSNRLMWSLPGQPWAVPLINFKDASNLAGGPTPNIKAVVPIRDKVVVWTDAGTFQITGSYPFFELTDLDPTVNIVAPKTAVSFANYATAWTNQGLVLASESIRVVSTPIDNTLKSLLANHKTSVTKYAFAVPYETEHALLLWVPANGTDTHSAQAFPFWYGAGETFSRWTLAATAAFIRPSDGKLYAGKATLKQERKAFAASDHSDDSAAISSVVEFSPILPVGPGAEAELEGGSFDFSDTNFASATTQMATNLEPSLSTALAIAPAGGATTEPREIPFPIPTAYTRGTRFRIRFNHATAGERYAIQGVTLTYKKVSDQAGR